MCGILGSIPAIPLQKFKKALDLLAHRGPDGYGIWADEAQKVTLGHRRLAIVDLSDKGKQPMHYDRYVITSNSEIYNFPELRSQLETKGHRFKTNCDTEVILAAYLQWGIDAFARFNGMWAMAIWDKVAQKLILSRDRFGQKPLFYSLKNGQLTFASEMKALIPFFKKVDLSDDFQWMQAHFFDYEPTSKCLIKGIQRFPAAHWGVFENGELRTYRYWNTLDHIHPTPRSYKQQVAEFRALFLDACKIRMRADVSLGTALSGGVDSSATICSMAEIGHNMPEKQFKNDWQHAFVASLPGTPLDETYFAKKVTDHLQISATFIEIDPIKGIEQLPEALYLQEELYITSPIPMYQTYKAARDNGVFVTLDGHGADELFSGYDTFMFHAFMDCGLNPLAIQNLLQTYRNLAPPNAPQFRKPPVSIENYWKQVEWKSNNYDRKSLLLPELKKLFQKKQPHFKKGQTTITDLNELGHLNKALYQLFHTDNLPTLLRNYDRYSMAHGVEIRMPFLDHRVVSYCLSVPWSSKLRRGYTKTLLRDAMSPFVPGEVNYRKWKMGFQTPIVDWLQGAWKEFFMDIMHSQDFRQSNLIDARQVQQDLEKVIFDKKATYRQGELAYAAINPFLWEKFVYGRFLKENK